MAEKEMNGLPDFLEGFVGEIIYIDLGFFAQECGDIMTGPVHTIDDSGVEHLGENND